jgi:hypothetical protein
VHKLLTSTKQFIEALGEKYNYRARRKCPKLPLLIYYNYVRKERLSF